MQGLFKIFETRLTPERILELKRKQATEIIKIFVDPKPPCSDEDYGPVLILRGMEDQELSEMAELIRPNLAALEREKLKDRLIIIIKYFTAVPHKLSENLSGLRTLIEASEDEWSDIIREAFIQMLKSESTEYFHGLIHLAEATSLTDQLQNDPLLRTLGVACAKEYVAHTNNVLAVDRDDAYYDENSTTLLERFSNVFALTSADVKTNGVDKLFLDQAKAMAEDWICAVNPEYRSQIEERLARLSSQGHSSDEIFSPAEGEFYRVVGRLKGKEDYNTAATHIKKVNTQCYKLFTLAECWDLEEELRTILSPKLEAMAKIGPEQNDFAQLLASNFDIKLPKDTPQSQKFKN